MGLLFKEFFSLGWGGGGSSSFSPEAFPWISFLLSLRKSHREVVGVGVGVVSMRA